MMQCEFEEMIGKQVAVETFEVYEKMYMALPDSYSKQDFIKMLNIKAIPEREHSPEYIAMIEDWKRMLKDKQGELTYWQERLADHESWVRFWEGDETEDGKLQLKWNKDGVKDDKLTIKKIKETIRSLKNLLGI